MHDFNMPSLGADMEAGTLREWRVKIGDLVKHGDIIADVETQKGIVEIEIFESGKIEKLLINVNDKVPVGAPMATLSSENEKTDSTVTVVQTAAPAIKTEEKKSERVAKDQRPPISIKASPLAKKVAAELHVDLTSIHGTGPEGAITKEDVEKAEAQKENSAEKTEHIRHAVAAAMSLSNREIPHYYLETKIDMTEPLKWLAEVNKQRSPAKKISITALLIKALSKGLKEVPELNAIWKEEPYIREEINIGIVVALIPNGVVNVCIQNADKKTLDEIVETLSDLIPRARQLKLKSSELSNFTITISNLGSNNVEIVYGVIYPPQVALLGFGSITEQPWIADGKISIRSILTATLAGDHRATDGQSGGRLLNEIKKNLQHPEKLQ